jgi:hypothetical protein
VAFTCGSALDRRHPNRAGVFVRDLHRRTTKLVSDRGRFAGAPQLSRDARTAAYMATVANGCSRAFVRRRGARTANRVPIARHDARPGHVFVDSVALSPDGRYVVTITSVDGFSCRREQEEDRDRTRDRIRLTVFDRRTGRSRRIRAGGAVRGETQSLVASRQAAVIVVGRADPPPADQGLFAIRRRSGRTVRVDVTSDERVVPYAGSGAGSPTISDNGRFVAFDSYEAFGPNENDGRRLDVYVRDLRRGTTELVSLDTLHADDEESASADISGNGRYVAFETFHANAPSPTNGYGPWAFVRDRKRGTTTIASVDAGGRAQPSIGSAISADGRAVSFESRAPLVPDDTNADFDTYVRRLR